LKCRDLLKTSAHSGVTINRGLLARTSSRAQLSILPSGSSRLVRCCVVLLVVRWCIILIQFQCSLVAKQSLVRKWRCSCREGFAACCLAARIPGCHKRKLLCQRPIGPRQNNIVIGQDQEASERKMCKKNVVDQFRLVYRVRCLLPLKQIR
jgi:hypothetical protein